MKLYSIFMNSGQGEGRRTEGGHLRCVGGLPFDVLRVKGGRLEARGVEGGGASAAKTPSQPAPVRPHDRLALPLSRLKAAGREQRAEDRTQPAPSREQKRDRGPKPGELFVDASYGSGENLLAAHEREIALSAPITCGRAPDLKKVQFSDFEVSPDCRQVLSCFKVHAPLECRSLEHSYAVEARMVA